MNQHAQRSGLILAILISNTLSNYARNNIYIDFRTYPQIAINLLKYFHFYFRTTFSNGAILALRLKPTLNGTLPAPEMGVCFSDLLFSCAMGVSTPVTSVGLL